MPMTGLWKFEVVCPLDDVREDYVKNVMANSSTVVAVKCFEMSCLLAGVKTNKNFIEKVTATGNCRSCPVIQLRGFVYGKYVPCHASKVQALASCVSQRCGMTVSSLD